MKLISWNIAGKVIRCEEQVSALHEFNPDLLALQEVRPKAAAKLAQLLSDIGLTYSLDTTHLAMQNTRRYGVFIASRWPVQLHLEQFAVPQPERSLSVQVHRPQGALLLHTVHVPPGDGWIRIGTMEAIYDHLSQPSVLPRILCGDFNAPKAEGAGGEVVTWEQTIRKNGTVKIRRGRDRWDKVERNLITGLTEHNLVDIFRHLNGYGTLDASWRQAWSQLPGYRLDHIFASLTLKPRECRYLHHLRDAGLSDHSPMEAVFADV